MLKKILSMSLIHIIFLTAFAQAQVKAQTNRSGESGVSEPDKAFKALELKQIFAESRAGSFQIPLDAKKLQKDSLNSARASNFSKGQKTALYIGVSAAVAATVLIIIFANRKKDPVVEERYLYVNAILPFWPASTIVYNV